MAPSMKTILIQLDTDAHPSPFDAIAAYDAGVEVVLGFGAITADGLDDVVQGAVFPRGPEGLANTAFWVGGSKVRDGEAVFEAARKLFFDPFKPSIMLDSDGSNTTAAAAVAMVRKAVELKGNQAAVIGVGPVGLRTAELLRREDAEVTVLDVSARRVRGRASGARPGIPVAQEAGFEVTEPQSSDELDAALAGHVAVFAAGPAGMQILRRSGWAQEGVQVVVDYSAAEPVGVEGVARDDELEEEDGVQEAGGAGGRRTQDEAAEEVRAADVRAEGHGDGSRGRLRRRPRDALSAGGADAALSRGSPRVTWRTRICPSARRVRCRARAATGSCPRSCAPS